MRTNQAPRSRSLNRLSRIKCLFQKLPTLGLAIGSIAWAYGNQPALAQSTNARSEAEASSKDQASSEDRATYQRTVEIWREENEAKLKAPRGWLALIAHAWLSEGENRIGNGSSDKIPVPKDLESTIRGSVVVQGDKIELHLEPGTGLTVNGKEVDVTPLSIDATRFEANSSDRIQWNDRVSFQLVRRVGRYAIRVRDSQSDAIAAFPGKDWFDINPRYRIQANYHPYESPKSVTISNIRGDATPAEIVGYVEFEWEGKLFRLDAMSESPGELFIVFRDLSSGRTTYGPGRFLDAKIPKDGEPVELDFNRAYNPPCAVSPHTLCPLPPKQNHLPFEILAGEKKPAEL